MIRYNTYWVAWLLGAGALACSPSPTPPPPPTSAAVPAPDEDDLLLRLSALYSSDTTRAARDNNVLLDYALENLLDIAPTASGLYYQHLSRGSGDSITWGQALRVHYRGYLPDGTVFADSRKRDVPLDFYVGNMIPAWNEGLQLARVGGRLRLLVPSHLGYGEKGLVGGSNNRVIVAPHQILLFDIDILETIELEED